MIRLATLKRQVITRVSVAATIMFLSIGGYYFLDIKSEDLHSTQNQLKSEIGVQQSKLEKIIQQKKDFSESLKIWERLSNNTKNQEGLKIDDGQRILEQLKEKYKLSSFSSEFTLPVELTNNYRTDTTVVVSSTVNLRFQSITDEYALSFINALMTEFPGYVKIETLNLRRNGDVTPDVLKKIGAGEQPPLVDGSVIFAWQDLKALSTGGAALKQESGGQQQ